MVKNEKFTKMKHFLAIYYWATAIVRYYNTIQQQLFSTKNRIPNIFVLYLSKLNT